MSASTWSVTFTPHPPAGAHVWGSNDSLADASALADRVVADLFASSPERRAVTVEIARPCRECGGAGVRPSRRKKLYPDACGAKDCRSGYVLVHAESRLREPIDGSPR